MPAKYKDKDWLYQKYWGEGLSTVQIAELCNVSSVTISYWMIKLEIDNRTRREVFGGKVELYQNKNWIHHKYWVEKLSTVQIAKLCDVSDPTIGRWMKTHGIRIRTLSEAKKKNGLFENKDWLYQKYWGEKLPAVQIAELCEVSKPTILSQMRKVGITRRTISEAKKGKSTSLLGQHQSEEHRRKNGEAHKGKIPWNKGRINKITKICEQCGKEFKAYSSRPHRFCSKKCFYEFNKDQGNPAWKGGEVNVICKTCGAIFNIPRAHVINTGNFCSMKCSGKWRSENIFGKNHPNYIDGKGNWPHPLEFNSKLKASIRKRDDYQCQECGVKENGKAHSCHHIDYDKKNSESENLILLCNSCHAKTNYNRQYWENHFVFKNTLSIKGDSQ